MSIEKEAGRRRTFAIISHPDAGKTTLTEKLLLYSGAIHLAGSIKSRKAARHTVSDWMKLEQERGISVTSSVLQFEYKGRACNLLDTPGHADFSEDTYRTLAAVDSSIMLIDHAKGVESRTLKLFEVCRMRNLPIVTFMNKLDRDGMDPLGLIDEISDDCVCPEVYDPVCGVDGNSYQNSCYAECVDIEYYLNGELDNSNPCNPMECYDGQWLEIIIDCAEQMGVPCDGGVYVAPPDDVCCSTCVQYGDSNADGTLDVLDVVILVNYILNPDNSQLEVADINIDGVVNVLDVVTLVNIILNP